MRLKLIWPCGLLTDTDSLTYNLAYTDIEEYRTNTDFFYVINIEPIPMLIFKEIIIYHKKMNIWGKIIVNSAD